jgi:phenol hydroxylase P2 protein
MSNVFIAFQHNEESRRVVDAIVADNPPRWSCVRPAS